MKVKCSLSDSMSRGENLSLERSGMVAGGCCVKLGKQHHTAPHLFEPLLPRLYFRKKPFSSFSFSTRTHWYSWLALAVRAEFWFLVSLHPESLCSGTDIQRGNSLLTVSHACLEMLYSCQRLTFLLLFFPPLSAPCLHHSTEKDTTKKGEMCCSCHPHSYMKIVSQRIRPCSHRPSLLTGPGRARRW